MENISVKLINFVEELVNLDTLRNMYRYMIDEKLWNNIIDNKDHPHYDLLPPKRLRYTRERGHNFILPLVQTERFKRTFINRCFIIHFV